MTIQQAYDQWSTTYDRDLNLTRDLDARVTKRTLEALRCNVILEIGCGTGKNTPLLARIGRRVHALDFSPGMLARAREKLSLDNVSFSAADLTRRWPCQAQSVELVVCNLVLEHIENLAFVFSEASRTLVDQGRFFICELHPYRQYQGGQANFQQERETIAIPAFIHHISDFLEAAIQAGLTLEQLREWRHEADQNEPPRLASFIFEK